MKRLLILLVVVAAMLFALPATAKKPPKPPPEPPPELICEFNIGGVLIDSGGSPITLGEGAMGYRCKLTADPEDSFEFVIGTTDGATVVQFPYIAVTDVYPSGGNICFRDYVRRVRNPDSEKDYDFVTFVTDGRIDTYGESDGTCGVSEDTDDGDIYALTFQIGNIKGGTVQLMVTPAPMQPE